MLISFAERRILIKRESKYLSIRFHRIQGRLSLFFIKVRKSHIYTSTNKKKMKGSSHEIKITFFSVFQGHLKMKFEKEKYYPFIAISLIISIQSPNEIENQLKCLQ